MADFGFDLEQIARLIKLVESRGLEELIVEEEGRSIAIRGMSGGAAPDEGAGAPSGRAELTVLHSQPALPVESHAAMSETILIDGSASVAPVENRIAVEAPTVGVFYRAARPDDPPFVRVGDSVEVGQTIGILEAMKVFSEIPAEQAGTVVEIVAQNGQLVRPGEAIMYLAPD